MIADRPSPSRAELRTAAGLRLVLDRLVVELAPRPIDWQAIETLAERAAPTEVIRAMQRGFELAAEPVDIFGIDRWLTRELSMAFDVGELSPDANELLAEILIRWIAIVGMLRDPRRARTLAKTARLVTEGSARARVELSLSQALVACGRGPLPVPDAVREALGALVRARKLGADEQTATYAELQVRSTAGHASEFPIRQRLRDLAAAARLADMLIAGTRDDGFRAELEAQKTRLTRARDRLAQLGWFHRLVGFAPDS